MKWFYNLKIKTKLLTGFILVAAVVGMVGFVGITNIKTLDNSDTELYEKVTVPIAEAADMGMAFQRIRVNIRDMIAANDPQSIQEQADKIAERRAEISALAESFEAKIISEEMEQAFQAFVESRKIYGAELDAVMALAVQNQDAEALARLSETGSAGKASRVEQDALDKIIAMKVEDGKEKADANTVLANGSVTAMTAFMVIGVLIAIALGGFLGSAISKPLKKAVHMITEMSRGHFQERLNMDTRDEIGQMSAAMDRFADDLQNVVIGTMNQIAAGDVSAQIEARDPQDEIAPALKTTIETIRGLIAEATMLSQAAVEGRLDARGHTDQFKGGFRDIVAGVNNTLDAVVGPLNVAAEYVERISRGDIPPKITDTYNGDFNEIKNNLNICIDAVKALVDDAAMLEKAGVEGRLETRANASKHGGDFGKIVDGVNNTLDAVVGPLNVAAEYVERISCGDIPPKITDTYNGDFNAIKNNLNTCIEAVQALVDDAGMLAQAGIDGRLETRADASRHQGDFAAIVNGVNSTLDAVVAPVQEASATLKELARGNLNTGMVGNYNGDYSIIKDDMNQTIAFLKRYVDEITHTLEQLGLGNLDQQITSEYLGDFIAIKLALNEITTTLSNTMSDINIAAGQVEIGSQQISAGGQALSQGTTEQASSIQELTASIEEVASETKKNAVHANEANELAQKVRTNAEVGNDQMNTMVAAMVDINESSKNISKIIKVIDDIAFQTNILSLNAAVEAARAGQHGKGFAVVAEEVRSLAARSAEAAKETTSLIEGSIEKVETGTRIANQTEVSLKEILNEIEKVTGLVGDIAQASNEQATEIAQITQGIEQVSQVVQTNSATAEESAAASEELSGQAEMLKQMVGAFKLKGHHRSRSDSKQHRVMTAKKQNETAQPQIILDDARDKY